jgi:phosphoribosylformylglycinamidine cyclo-ligase
MKTFGLNIHYLGGETADVGDVVRTIAVNGTMMARWPKERLITNDKIKAGDVIVGLASFGRSDYETKYNSGIGSNGLTSARHDVLSKFYSEKFSESFDNSLNNEVVYIGKYRLTDEIEIQTQTSDPNSNRDKNSKTDVGHLLLSPTRTFAPVLKEILEHYFEAVHGLIHCSGGGQTKCMKYMPGNFRVIKDNLFDPPVIFRLIQQATDADYTEMYQVFNMGTRMEIYTDEKNADKLIGISKKSGVDARVIGRVGASDKKELLISTGHGEISF